LLKDQKGKVQNPKQSVDERIPGLSFGMHDTVKVRWTIELCGG